MTTSKIRHSIQAVAKRQREMETRFRASKAGFRVAAALRCALHGMTVFETEES